MHQKIVLLYYHVCSCIYSGKLCFCKKVFSLLQFLVNKILMKTPSEQLLALHFNAAVFKVFCFFCIQQLLLQNHC